MMLYLADRFIDLKSATDKHFVFLTQIIVHPLLLSPAGYHRYKTSLF